MNQTFLTPDPIVIEIRNAAGEVTIALDESATTTTVAVDQLPGAGAGILDDLMATFRREPVSAPSADRLADVRVDLRMQDGGGTVLIVDTDPARSGWRSGFAVRITAPAGSGVRAQTQSADLRTTGRVDRLDLRTASGDVQADRVERGSLVQTASGNIRIAEIGADAELRSASGDITVDRCGGSLSVHSTSGDVRIERPAQQVFVRAVSGDIRVSDAMTGEMQLTSVSGDIEIGVHAGSLARIDLSTVSGDTRNEFDVATDRPNTGTHPGADIAGADTAGTDTAGTDAATGENTSGEESGGRLEITCRSTSGDIRLRRVVALGV